ncbi:nucleotide exchange factor SIL1-like [Glandiceps talaboti]
MNARQCLWVFLSIFCIIYGITKVISHEANLAGQQKKLDDEEIDKWRAKQTAVVAVETDDDEEGDGYVTLADGEDEELEVFYPTKDWQTIKPGQAIPAGLHVRINLETGLKEAKLMDEEDKENDDGMKYWKEGERMGVVNTDKKSFSKEELKDALKLFKAKQDDVKHEIEGHEEEIKKQFRSYDDLKKDFEDMNINIETDAEIIVKLLDKYKNDGATIEDRQTALQDLEYYAHQIDNARDLVSLGGLDLIIKGLNDTVDVIRQESAFVLGSAVQSNPTVQVEAVERGAIQLLLRLMSGNQPIVVKKKVLYAISSLIRQFPFAQKRFLELGGLSSLSSLFRETDSNVLPLKVKATTLLHDLLVEQKTFENTDITDDVTKERQRQYHMIPLLPAMIEQGWCQLIPTLLLVPEHDHREKVLHAMKIMLDPCTEYYKQLSLEDTLHSLHKEYEDFALEEAQENDGDLYFTGLKNLIGEILDSLHTRHTEL